MVMPPLITLKKITAGFGHPELFKNLELSVKHGERIALIGRNGSGKSTLLKIIAGVQQADLGERFIKPGTTVAYLDQENNFLSNITPHSYITNIQKQNGVDKNYLVEQFLSDAKILPNDKISNLSGGEMRRLSLAGVLIQNPNLLLLDEPTNHLDLASIGWLEKAIVNFKGAIIFISHDRTFLKNLSTSVLWLDRGGIHKLDKNYLYFEEWADKLLKIEAEDIANLDKLIEKETGWSHQGISARRKRNQGRLRRLEMLRQERKERRSIHVMDKIESYSKQLSGKIVAELREVSKHFNNETIIENFSVRITRGERIGVIGPNGAGKTTLLKLLTKEIKPDHGSVRLGTNIDCITFDQNRITLNPDATLWETLCESGGDHINVQGVPKHIVGYLQKFMFNPGQARSPVKSLSGGEKNRLMLAKFIAKPSNLMILDEPTNDLDFETLDLLEEMLSEYNGTIILVSHDRDFLDRIVTSTFVLEGDGRIQIFVGGYSEYSKQKRSSNQSLNKKNKIRNNTKFKSKTSAPQSAKLSYADKRELETITVQIKNLEKEIYALNNVLVSEKKNKQKIHQASHDLGEKIKILEKKENRWLELELLKEKKP